MTAYGNPIQRAGDFADPFVLRHDGRYYLYCTNPDVRCWSSRDLLGWKPEGPTIEEDVFPGLVPFAPEVVYADGAFYMYTSPSGHGHYVLRSGSPTGPFLPVSGNVGHAIDGNVFIDDDGRWYFYWAGDEGIWGCEMSSPTEFGEPVFTGIHMNGWTEGPFVSKRDGVYSMTLTGNHYLSPGYRIDAAWSRHPLHGYRADPFNPILISTEGPAVGLGHSSSVPGPDLVSTYLVYHNLNPDASRDLDIDRQVWSGRSLQVLGPTTSAPVPAGPDAWCDWSADGATGWRVSSGELEVRDGAGFLSGTGARVVWDATTTGEVFTAEVNLTAAESGAGYGLALGDALVLRVDRDAGTVSAVSARDAVLASSDLPSGFGHHALHCWRLVGDRGELRVFVDGRLQLSLRHEPDAGSHVGVFADAGPLRIGHVALSRAVAADADRTVAKPVPGRFWAALGEGGVDVLPPAETEDGPGYESVRLQPGEGRTYELHVQRAGAVTVYIVGAFDAGDVLALAVDDGDPHEVRVDDGCGLVSVPVELRAGTGRLTLRGVEGAPVAALITIVPTPEARAITSADERLDGTGKRIVDGGSWDDFALTATVSFTLDGADAHADLLLRATQLSEGGEGDDTLLGIDFLLGYSVQLHHDRVVFARHAYDQRVLAERELPIDASVPHELFVRADGGTFVVGLDGGSLFHVDDALPHALGRIGLRTYNAHLHVETLQVEPETRSTHEKGERQ